MHSYRTVVLAALVAAVVDFVWGGVSHLALIKGVGFSALPAEDAVIASLRGAVSADGLYAFPAPDFSGQSTPDERARWEAKFKAGPTGMLIYHPAGSDPFSPAKLVLQLLAALAAGAIVAFVLSRLAASTAVRVAVSALLGAFSVLAVSTLYWNWYGFPDAFFVAQAFDQIVGWTLAGSAAAWLLRPRAAVAKARPRQAA